MLRSRRGKRERERERKAQNAAPVNPLFSSPLSLMPSEASVVALTAVACVRVRVCGHASRGPFIKDVRTKGRRGARYIERQR